MREFVILVTGSWTMTGTMHFIGLFMTHPKFPLITGALSQNLSAQLKVELNL
jgi:hypothetical protein